jgi:hypothetical protein
MRRMDPLLEDYGPGKCPYGTCPECSRHICPYCADMCWWPTADSGKCIACCRREYSVYKNTNCDGSDDDRFDDGVAAYIEKKYGHDD